MDPQPSPSNSPRITLLRSRELPDGVHSSSRLKNAVNSGELLRLRRSIYVRTADWLAARPWERHLAATAATAMTRTAPVFCRETALALHGIALLGTPDAVQLRTPHQGGARLVVPPGMTGSADPALVVRRHQPSHDDGPRSTASAIAALRGIPTRLHEHVAPPRTSRSVFRQLLGEGGYAPPQDELLLSFHDEWPRSVSRVTVERLGLVLADTVPRMETAAGVVVLDAVLGRRSGSGASLDRQALGSWGSCIGSQRRRRRWQRALELADGLSESAGESLSRVRMLEMGLAVPTLQARFDLGRTVARVDFYWPEAGVVGEFDGRMKYMRSAGVSHVPAEEVVWEEKLREDALRARGLKVVRWVWADLHRPGVLEARLRAAGVPSANKS